MSCSGRWRPPQDRFSCPPRDRFVNWTPEQELKGGRSNVQQSRNLGIRVLHTNYFMVPCQYATSDLISLFVSFFFAVKFGNPSFSASSYRSSSAPGPSYARYWSTTTTSKFHQVCAAMGIFSCLQKPQACTLFFFPQQLSASSTTSSCPPSTSSCCGGGGGRGSGTT